jgi:hypothetical protein
MFLALDLALAARVSCARRLGSAEASDAEGHMAHVATFAVDQNSL